MPTFGNAVMPPIEETWMMCPLRCSRRYGSAAWGDPQRTEHVGFDLIACVLLGQFFDEAELAVAGVVDDDVQPAEVIVGLLDRSEVRVDAPSRIATIGPIVSTA